jgi:hypothetical protein
MQTDRQQLTLRMAMNRKMIKEPAEDKVSQTYVNAYSLNTTISSGVKCD